MTAINVFRLKDRICFLTDGAGYDSSGILRMAMAKSATISHLRAAVATRGPAAATAIFAAGFSTFQTFDDLSVGAVEAMRKFWTYPQAVQVIFGGWSEANDAPESYVITTTAAPGEGIQPWTLTPLDPFTAAPIPSGSACRQAGLRLESLSPETFDPVEDGAALIEAQRRMVLPFGPESAETGHTVGLHATLTTITRDETTQRVLKRWPDAIGQPIIPAANLN